MIAKEACISAKLEQVLQDRFKGWYCRSPSQKTTKSGQNQWNNAKKSLKHFLVNENKKIPNWRKNVFQNTVTMETSSCKYSEMSYQIVPKEISD